jgi:hypothetical protein
MRYTGVDASEYVVRRYGAARNIVHGHFGDLANLGLRGRFDLVICNGGIYYVPDAELAPGFGAIERLCNGLAYLEMFAIEDGTLTGDTKGLIRRPLAAYKRLLARAGLTPVGMHGYVGAGLAEALAELQKGRPVR